MISCSVDMNSCFSRKVFKATGGGTLDRVKQPNPTLLGKATIICGSARHTGIISRLQPTLLLLCNYSVPQLTPMTRKIIEENAWPPVNVLGKKVKSCHYPILGLEVYHYKGADHR